GPITTEFAPATDFFYAEAYHQQYLAKNVEGTVRYYCPDNGTGVGIVVIGS
ncbi:MAG: peptide-methionine (S)-S-oxide reductase, partial [Chloroflexota bacterium]|nr:peptide-methionine (S)-S-oxide reductase [Chloroflexota bacterium]